MAYDASSEEKELLGSISKNERGDSLKISKITNKKSGNISLDVRNFYTDKAGDEAPTAKGVRINSEILLDVLKYSIEALDVTELDALKDAIDNKLDESSVDDSDVPDEN